MMRLKLMMAAAALLMNVGSRADTKLVRLRVQHTVEPQAVDEKEPVFGWAMESDQPGVSQKAYRLTLHTEHGDTLMWDSGKVTDASSTGVTYKGQPLKPLTGYRWTLSVWDNKGKEHTGQSAFFTGLMDCRLPAWSGAQWIGSTAQRLSAPSNFSFTINTRFRIERGHQAAILLGANDFRLRDAFQNIDNMQGTSYVRVELDFPEAQSGRVGALRVYRVGFTPTDQDRLPLLEVSEKSFPQSNISSLLTEEGTHEEHELSVCVETGNISFLIDGVALTICGNGFPGHLQPLLDRQGNTAEVVTIGQWGGTHDHNSYPNLCEVGFAALPHARVVYQGYNIQSRGCSEDTEVFGPAQYGRFHGLSCVAVKGDRIVVDNPSDRIRLAHADPSHGALTMLRTSFRLSGKVREAHLLATAMGACELHLNGKPVSQDRFVPGSSQYREVLGYASYDVTSMLRQGKNALGALLLPAWYTGNMSYTTRNYNFWGDHEALLAKLVVRYEDGREEVIVTSPGTWRACNDGPWRYGSFFNGEVYDARQEALTEGWSTPAYKANKRWRPAEVITMRPWQKPRIESRYDSPVRVRERLSAQRVMPVHSADGHTYTYDMGVNMVGVPEITFPEGFLQRGDTVIIRYGEQLYPGLYDHEPRTDDERWYADTYGPKGSGIAGRILQANLRAALVTDFYVSDGSGRVVYSPRSTYRGYQYVQITLPSSKQPLAPECVGGLVLSSDSLPTGTYHAETWDGVTGRLVNQLFRNIQRSQLGNFFTLPTDCPQRNERMGWTGDAQAYARTAAYNSDVYGFFLQWMRSLRADQTAEGGIGSTIPEYSRERPTGFPDGTTWGAAVCMVPWQMWCQYGDRQIVQDNLDAMVRWLDGMAGYPMSERFPHLSSRTGGLADWLAMDARTPADLVNNAIYIYMMEVTARMASAVGRPDISRRLTERHRLAKQEWNLCYVDEHTGQTRSADGEQVHTQSSYATPLNFNCFSSENLQRAQQWLACLAEHPSQSGKGAMDFPDHTITTGFSGTPNILPALSRSGHWAEAFRMFTCTDFTSWLYPVTHGATSVWERWNGFECAFGQHQENTMNSFNHFALGAVGQWMYEYQLGITQGEESGYRQFVLQPECSRPYKSLSGGYCSDYGEIRSEWTADEQGDMMSYRAVVPANTSCTLYLPMQAHYFRSSAGARFAGLCEHHGREVARYELDAGTHSFVRQGDEVTVR